MASEPANHPPMSSIKKNKVVRTHAQSSVRVSEEASGWASWVEGVCRKDGVLASKGAVSDMEEMELRREWGVGRKTV